MHFELPKKTIASAREFASHYAMIVLSILTALALEQVAVNLHHQSEAKVAKAGIEQEIVDNRQRLAASTSEVDGALKIWQSLMAQGVQQLKSHHSSDAERLQLLREAAKNYKDGLPSLRTNAWDMAIANQSVNYFAPADRQRYAVLYSAQKQFSQTVLSLALDCTVGNLSNLAIALNTDRVEPLDSVRILDWRVRTLSMIESNIRQLEAALADATK